jgi:exodeoxyribonuclease I
MSAFMRFSQKAAVCEHVAAEPIFCLADFYFGAPYFWLVTVIGTNPDNSSEFYVYKVSTRMCRFLPLIFLPAS